MKYSFALLRPFIAVAVAQMTVILPLSAGVEKAEGSITTDRGLVLPDSVVTVDWQARYPVRLVSREPSGTLVSSTRVRVNVRVIGAAFGSSKNPLPLRGWVTTSAQSGWTQIFFGNSNTYDPQTVVWTKVLEAGEKLDFRFQGSQETQYDVLVPSSVKRWNEAIDTTPTSARPFNRAVLVNGEEAPNFNPAFDQADVHAHLGPYFQPGTLKLKLGERDFIYLTELSEFHQGHQRTDMQDLVFLVSYEEMKTGETGETAGN